MRSSMQMVCKFDATQEMQQHSRGDSEGVKEWDLRHETRFLMTYFVMLGCNVLSGLPLIVLNEGFRMNANTPGCACSIDVQADMVEA